MTLPESEDFRSESPPSKRFKKEEEPQANKSSSTNISTFCDDLMLEIFSYLQPEDLLALSQCCEQFQRVVHDRTLWGSVDFRPLRLSATELKQYVKFFLPSTRLIATRGPWSLPAEPRTALPAPSHAPSPSPSLTGDLIDSIANAAPNLTTLIVENHVIDSQELQKMWEKLPQSLQELTLQCCHLVTSADPDPADLKSFFFGIDKALPNLKSLDLSESRWFESHSLLALSKCQQLQELRLADCCLISDFVPYISLSTRFGFKALSVVDFRRTWVSDREVSCLSKTATLRELYLESPGGERARGLISDLAVTAFGATLDEWSEMGYHVLLMSHFEGFKPSSLRVLTLRGYSSVSDTSLRHCSSCLRTLRHLDVRGTSVTQPGILHFITQRPDVHIQSDFQLALDPQPESREDDT